MKSWLASGHRIKSFGLIVLVFLLLVTKVHSDTTWEDIGVKLSIEIGDSNEDFDDAEDTVEKGRFVTYRVEVANTGDQVHSSLVVLMEPPEFMNYVPGSTAYMADEASGFVGLSDADELSPLNLGYEIDNIYPGSSVFFSVRYQVAVPDSEKDDPIYTLAWANVMGKYAVTPTLSNLIETAISGEAKAVINVVAEPSPPAGQPVDGGLYIDYQYTLHNVGGLPANGIIFKPYLPQHTTCAQDCGNFSVTTLQPDEEAIVTMVVQVDADLEGVTQIENIGYDLNADEIDFIENRDPIIHPVGEGAIPEGGDFVVTIEQVPNIILNSANGIARADKGDLTETVYDTWYAGRHQQYTYPALSTNEGYTYREGMDCSYWFPHKFNAYTYAYNSVGGGCDGYISSCPPMSTPIQFSVSTVLPGGAPKLLFTKNTTSYLYGEASPDFLVNNYMKNGGTYQAPRIFTESRAAENGANGIVETKVTSTVSEDRWQYVQFSTSTCNVTCGENTCPIEIPRYRWQKVQSTPVQLSDTDITDITVYTSTAWLKTEGGHIGTNDRFTGNSLTDANYVDLGNPVIKPNFLTPSDTYTPPGETNSDYMIFGKNGTGSFKSASGDDWLQTGTEFPFLEQGEAYDRADNPRDYYQDMLVREKFGPVKSDQLESLLTGTVDIGDGIVWNQTGDITIGQTGGTEVVFTGGQSRIYTAGDVYINSDIRLGTSQGQSYRNITSLRIDARNIYVSGLVTNLEVMLLARGSFYSGVSKNQLRILGDVIAGKAHWERQPLLEVDPEEFNKPSEYIIEDMRKYVIPVPGDTTVPDDYNIWRQVNPATGQTLDAY
ncbi:MAG: hypothetical protein V1880_01715 [Patescibacteria group bacterium]